MFSSKITGVGCKRSLNRDGNGEYFCTSVSDNIIIYGIFGDCYDKVASKFAAKHLPLEFLNLWKEQVEKPDIETMLRMVFEIIENKLLQLQTARKISGTSALVVVIYGNELYVANTGCNRALMFIRSENIVGINQLTQEHNLNNSKELKRIADLGLDHSHLSSSDLLGHRFTRCLGNVNLKKFYRNLMALSNVETSPWISTPDIVGPVEINASCIMLVMLSSGIIHHFLNEGYMSSELNNEIVSKINHQTSLQPTLNDAVQSVVDEIDSSLGTKSTRASPQDVDSLPLIAHCFYNPFVISPSDDKYQIAAGHLEPISIEVDQSGYDSSSQLQSCYLYSSQSSRHGTIKSACESYSKSPSKLNKLVLDENGRIAPYVEFSSYYETVDKLAADHKLDSNLDYNILLEFENNSKGLGNV